MADFVTNLWESVFTPGTTPTLLLATNVAFAALQVVLAALLAATYSIHFAILSFLCAGLWYSINWFSTELQAAQAKEQEIERLRRRKRNDGNPTAPGEVDDNADDEGEDTEVEGGLKESTASFTDVSYDATQIDEDVRPEVLEAMKEKMRATMEASARSSALQASTSGRDTRQRRVEDGERSGDLSTDSEWEKVEES